MSPVSPGCSLLAVLELPSDSIPVDYAETQANVRACGPRVPSLQGRASDKTCPKGHLLSRGVHASISKLGLRPELVKLLANANP